MTRTVTIIKPGFSTSIQDQGRYGYYHLGIPPSGAMDQYSYRAANLLVGNPIDAAVLECTFLAPELKFNSDTIIAITGAHIIPKIDGQEVPTNTSLHIAAESVLSFGFMSLGARSYIAFDGGIAVPKVLGSRSFYSLGNLGGLNGQKLQAGDKLPLGDSASMQLSLNLPIEKQIKILKKQTIRVIPGLYDYRLTSDAKINFYADEWKISPEADRVGYRCKGSQALTFIERNPPFGAGSDPSNIVDAPYPIGSIQIPAGLEPIILHRDAVSAGGYAMIATVISADMDLIGQLQPNYIIKFESVTMEEALNARVEYQKSLKQLNEHFN